MKKDKLNTILQGDCIELLKQMPDNSVDLIFADPPYNLQLNGELYRPDQSKVDGVDDKWDKFDSMLDYDEFCKKWLGECHRVLKETGSIWVIGTYHNIFRVGYVMQNIGFWMLNDVIWIKSNPMPNFKGTRFNNAHETLIWATKSKESKYTFHYHSLKCMNDDLQMRSDWYLPICQGKERVMVDGHKAHSTQKPVELLYRIILSTSNVDDVVLDPFFGSGTTGAVAKKLRRNYIGMEKEQFYIDVATKRINEIEPLHKELLEYKIEMKKPNVPFGNLIESGMIKAGQKIFSRDKKYEAIVNANGSITYQDITASIHKVSASILNKDSSNGWSYWYVDNGNGFENIDQLRYEYQKQFNGFTENNYSTRLNL
jgi:DNA modification methylase